LRYATKDARDIEKLLVQQAGFKPTHVRTLLDSAATGSAIVDNLGKGWLSAVSRPGDLVFLFVSSHGTPTYKELGAFNSVVAYDSTLDHLFSTSIPMQRLGRMVNRKLGRRHAFVVFDTCYAGGLGAPGNVTLDNVDPEMLMSSRLQLLMSSSDIDQRSWESRRYHNSVFTRQLIAALEQNPRFEDFHKVFLQVRDRVNSEVTADFGNKQTPKLSGRWSGRGLIHAQGTAR
jgi:hypothetical protein